MKLCIALDLNTLEENLELVKKVKSFDVWLKIGFRSYIRDGHSFIKEIKNINPDFKIFLDLKLYDIPNTMATTAFEIASLGIDMFNVHASCGKIAMQEVMKTLSSFDNPPIVLAVTALTSFENDDFRYIYGEDINTKAISLAKDSFDSGINGVVCSAFESRSIKENTNNSFMTLSPGIRPFGEDAQDQSRVANIEQAQEQLVDFVVVGRPIYNAQKPEEIVKRILDII